MALGPREFQFFKAVRVPINSGNDIRFLAQIEKVNAQGVLESRYIDDAKIIDMSVHGLCFRTTQEIALGEEVDFSIQFKKLLIDIQGKVVRSNRMTKGNEEIVYGIEVSEQDTDLTRRFLELYIKSVPNDMVREGFLDLIYKNDEPEQQECLEMFSLVVSIFKDFDQYANQDGISDYMLKEVMRTVAAQQVNFYMINTENNELQTVASVGLKAKKISFDYRKGIPGSVFTTGFSVNLNRLTSSQHFSEELDEVMGIKTESVICHPIYNREEKIIGVIEAVNKREQDRFSEDDEKAMKVISLIFSYLFHSFNPVSKKTIVRRFSSGFNRKYVMIGKSHHVSNLRKSIGRLKDLNSPLLIKGERGVGKTLMARIIAHEGKRSLAPFVVIDCERKDELATIEKLIGTASHRSLIEKDEVSTILIKNIDLLCSELQFKFLQKWVHLRKVHGFNQKARIICTAGQDLKLLMKQRKFNQHLYHLISDNELSLIPLRKRTEDIHGLIYYFIKKECQENGIVEKDFSDTVMRQLNDYSWPGNIGELREAVRKIILFHANSRLVTNIDKRVLNLFNEEQDEIFSDIPHINDSSVGLKDRMTIIEREMIMREIKRNKGNKSKTARLLGISREALRKKLIAYDDVMQRLKEREQEVELNIAA